VILERRVPESNYPGNPNLKSQHLFQAGKANALRRPSVHRLKERLRDEKRGIFMNGNAFPVLSAVLCLLLVSGLSVPALQAASSEQLMCEEWCQSHPDWCAKCSDRAGCGTGYHSIITFNFSGRDSWHACQPYPGTRENKAACEEWCNLHKDPDKKPYCIKCSPDTGCGIGFKVLYSFTGPGKDFYACEKSDYGRHSDENRQACQAWCAANRDKGCVKCDTKRYCGPGFEAMKHFDGKGDNWHACRKQ
jgi:hypothetical protein